MIPEQAALPVQTWWLEPRDPLVFGDGSRIPALAPRHRFLLPPQATLAGTIRTRLVAGQANISKEDARALLGVRIRGPWLARRKGAAETPEIWLPIPADVRTVKEGSVESYLAGEILDLAMDEGSLWPDGTPSPKALFRLPDRLKGGTKTSPPGFPFWPFDKVVRWSLRPGNAEAQTLQRPAPVSPEYRVHVAIEDTTWTAEPEALFSSAGLRYDTDFGIVAEVSDGRGAPGPPEPGPDTPPHLLVLGAEARTAASQVLPSPCFPDFDAVRELYRERIEELVAAGQRIGLRLQLLTPGAFGGWQPAWPDELENKLLAVCLERFVPVSGWDLQNRKPRGVRRLVPAGSLYFLGPFDANEVLNLCSAWWGRSLCEGLQGDEEALLAPPSHDGYGLVLPAPFAFHGATHE